MKIKIDLKLITSISLFLAVFFLPLKTTLSNFGIILLSITSVASFFKNGIDLNNLHKFKFYLTSTIILYVPFLMGILYASSYGQAFDELERCVFYLLVPIILLRTDLSRGETLKLAAWALVLGSIICILYLHTENIIRFIESGKQFKSLLSYNFTGKGFVAPLIDMHPVYIGTYLLMAIVLIKGNKININRYLKTLIYVLMLGTILFLASRIIFLATFVVVTIMFLTQMKLRTQVITVVISLLTLTMAFPIIKNTYVYNKLVKGAIWELGNNVDSSNIDSKKKSDSRMSRWTVSYQIIMEKPFFGHGTGSEQDKLVEGYESEGMKTSEKQKFNAHNQFLGFGIQFGIVGILLLLMYFLINFREAILKLDYLSLSFIIMLFCCCLTENYLIRNMGVNFVAIFGAILRLNKNTNA